jgi:hypothetical protein
MKKTKRIISMLLAVLMITTCFTVVGMTTASAATDDLVIVAGNSATLFGTEWDSANTANQMTLGSDGKYTKSYTTTEALGQVQFKVTVTAADGSGTRWIGNGEDNIAISVNGAGTFTITYDPTDDSITATGSNVGEVTFTVDAMYAVGNGDPDDPAWMNGASWNPAAAANKMTKVSDGVYAITFENVSAFDNYEIKFATNGNWNDNWGILDDASVQLEYGVWMDAVYNSQRNITVEVTDDQDGFPVTAYIDISNFDYSTKQGAKFKIVVGEEDEVAATLKFAVPKGSIGAWSGAELYYTDGQVLSQATIVPMTNTGETIVVTASGVKSLGPGNYEVWEAALTQAQVDAIDASRLVGFRNTNGSGRTGTNYNCQVLRAPDKARAPYTKETNQAGVAQAARKVADVQGKIFVIDGYYMAAAETSSYKGHWATTGDAWPTSMHYVWAPITGKGSWTGVELFYGNSTNDLKTVIFNKASKTRATTSRLSTLPSGDWACFCKTINLNQALAIDASKIVGFRNRGGAGQTAATAAYDLTKAPTSASGSYSTQKISIMRRAGWKFLILGCADSANEQNTYTGFWYFS